MRVGHELVVAMGRAEPPRPPVVVEMGEIAGEVELDEAVRAVERLVRS